MGPSTEGTGWGCWGETLVTMGQGFEHSVEAGIQVGTSSWPSRESKWGCLAWTPGAGAPSDQMPTETELGMISSQTGPVEIYFFKCIFRYMALIGSLFKVFIESVATLLLFCVLFFWPRARVGS